MAVMIKWSNWQSIKERERKRKRKKSRVPQFVYSATFHHMNLLVMQRSTEKPSKEIFESTAITILTIGIEYPVWWDSWNTREYCSVSGSNNVTTTGGSLNWHIFTNIKYHIQKTMTHIKCRIFYCVMLKLPTNTINHSKSVFCSSLSFLLLSFAVYLSFSYHFNNIRVHKAKSAFKNGLNTINSSMFTFPFYSSG